MSLVKYKKKRTASITPEPFGGKPDSDTLTFVVQKHAASHLHYDFRLEIDGVLKSWAVPKGPSTDPATKRLAMMVEDHPFDYRNFEGIIPEGQYGGGTVIVWDEGTFEPIEAIKGKAAQEKHLLKQLKSGSLKIKLKGKKLKGEYALVRTKGMGEHAWLMIKHDDKYASTDDITKKNKSVLSKKTLAQVEKTSTHILGEETVAEKAIEKKPVAKKKTLSSTRTTASSVKIPEHAGKGKFKPTLSPMLATLVDQPFDDKEWLYEIKWDGYRAVALMNNGKVQLNSRNDKSFNDKFYPVYDALLQWGVDAIIDGEIVVLNEKGQPDFAALQNWRSEADGTLVYYLFDMLWYQGYDLTTLPLVERKHLLEQIIPEHPTLDYSKSFETSGTEFFNSVKKLGLEGIMAKRKNSLYVPGERTANWLKIKANKRQEMVIGGYTLNEGSTKPFSSLLVGVFKGKDFIYTGKIGTGFAIKTQQELIKKFKSLVVKKPAFHELPEIDKPSRFRPNPPKASVKWLKPSIVCEVSFAEMTKDGVMRHPSFEGLREDKKANEVILEEAKMTDDLVDDNLKVMPDRKKQTGKRKTLLNPKDEEQVKKVNGQELKFTNLSKIYWPAEKITKREMINYYYEAAPFILPYLKDRPMSLNRHPDGIKGFSFYQKDVTGKVPDWAETYLYHAGDEEVDKHFLVAKDEASLLYMANIGCIEMNPWSSTIKKPEHPSWCIIDLDPDKNSFDEVIRAAQVTKEILDEMKVECLCKTSGSTGLHIYIPLGAKYTYEQSKEFARIIVTLLHDRLPDFTSLERTISKRNGKMYLDFLQNRPQATIAAPYSLRPKPGATVSMPLHWDEVKKGLTMKDFTIKNAIERMQTDGDIFKAVLGKGINLKKVLSEIE